MEYGVLSSIFLIFFADYRQNSADPQEPTSINNSNSFFANPRNATGDFFNYMMLLCCWQQHYICDTVSNQFTSKDDYHG
jgi:hypothetical protein